MSCRLIVLWVVCVAAAQFSARADSAMDPLDRDSAPPATSEPDRSNENNIASKGKLTIDLSAGYRYGNVSGYVQTPSGGEPGTSSHHRPTFNEMGIDSANIFDFLVTVRWEPHIFTVGGQIIPLTGSSTLSSDLISQSAVFPAGTKVHSDVSLDWYHIGYQYDFSFDLGGNVGRLHVAPGVDGVLLDFSYKLNGGGAHASRQYAKAGVQIGGTVEWQTDSPFSVVLNGWWGLPISNTAEILNVELVGRYQLWGSRDSGGAVTLGIGYEQIDYEDNQTLSNHVHAKLGPLLVAGLSIRF